MRSRLIVLAALFAVAAPLAAAEPIPITGEVFGEGKPLAGATARLSPLLTSFETARLRLAGKALPEPVATATSDAAGRFRLAAPGAGMWRVEVEAKGFAGEEIVLAPLTAPLLLPPLPLNQVADVAVSVTDAEGRPVAGAGVEATYDPTLFVRGWDEAPPAWIPMTRRATTGADGRAVLAVGIPRGAKVRATAPGHPPVESALGDGPVKLQLAAGCPQAVEILAGSRPVAGAVAAYKGVSAGPSDAAGRLTLTVACKEPISFDVAGDDGASVTVTAEARREAPLRAQLMPRRRLQGRVRAGHTGRPVAGAFVWPAGEPADFVVTGADGAYLAPIPRPEKARLLAAAVGYFTTLEPTATSGPEPLPGPEIKLAPALALHGTVVDEAGRGVPGTRLSASLAGLAPSVMLSMVRSGHEALTDEAGRFALQLSSGLEYRVKAHHPDFAPAERTIPPLPLGDAPPPLRLVLNPGITASGLVVDPDGKPLAGSMVTLSAAEAERPNRSWLLLDPGRIPDAVADAQGRFRFERLAPGRFDLVARAQGLAPTTVRGIAIPESPRRFDLGTVVLRPGERLTGTVSDREGAPLSGVTLTLERLQLDTHDVGGSGGDAVVSDREGNFAFDGLVPGMAVLSTEKEGYSPAFVTMVSVPAPAPVEIVLDRLLAVLCRLVEEGGAPVAHGRVRAQAAKSIETGGSFGALPGVADERGEVKLELSGPGRWELIAQAPGMLDATRVVEVGAQGLDEAVTLTMVRGAVVVGRVEGPDGSPLPEVTVSRLDRTETYWMDGMESSGSPRTDGNGAFRLGGLLTGPQSFVAFRRGYRKQVRDLDVRPGENRLDFRLEPGSDVSGRIVEQGGTPVAGAMVSLQGSVAYPGQVVTGTDGGFILAGVSAGTYQLAVHKKGYAGQLLDGIQVGSEPVAGLEVRLVPAGAIRGRIVGLDFAALSAVRVMASADRSSAQASVDFAGNYRFDNLAPGDWTVMAMAGSRLQQGHAIVEPGAETVLDLELAADGFRLTGRVLAGGRPAAGAMVAVGGREGGSGGFTTAGADGSFRFEGLAAGTYELRVQGMVHSFSHHRTLEIAGDTEVTIELGAARVAGQVSDPAGEPVAGAQLSLVPTETEGLDPLYAASDAEGRFVLVGAAPGLHQLQARKDGFSAAASEVDVPEGGDVEGLRLTLAPAPSLVLHVVGPAGVAPEWVGVGLLDASGHPVASGTYSPGERGRVEIKSAPAGRYRLLVGGLNTATLSLDVLVPGGPLPITLPAESTLKVRVVPLAGAVLGGKVVVLDRAGQSFQTVRGGTVTHSWDLLHGSATITGLPAGTWTLGITAPDGRAWQRQVTVGTGESAEVVIE